MSYVKTINEDGVVSDIMAVALDSELDATLLHKSELVNGFTQTTAGVNALDATAGKSLNDSLANLVTDVSTKAPKSHAANATTYGGGTGTNYGHVKLSDSYTSSSGAASASVGASSKAVYDAYTALSAMVVYRDLTITPSTAINVSANGSVYYSNYTNPSVSGYTCVSVSVLSQQGSAGGYCVFAPRASTSGMTICNNHSAAASITEIKLRYVFLKN